MNKTNIGSRYAVFVGFPVSLSLSLLAFSKSYYIDWMEFIGDFSFIEKNNNLFWGFLFPLFYLIILWFSGKNIDSKLKTASYIQTCFDFSFQAAKKILILLFAIYLIGLLVNGISVTLHSLLLDKIIFSLVMILSFSLFLICITFLISLLIVKRSQSKLKP
jgi:hypothetical protein